MVDEHGLWLLSFGERLGVIRTTRKLTQKMLAERAKVAVSSIAGYEAGKNEPGIYNAAKLARALDVDLNTLIGGIW